MFLHSLQEEKYVNHKEEFWKQMMHHRIQYPNRQSMFNKFREK